MTVFLLLIIFVLILVIVNKIKHRKGGNAPLVGWELHKQCLKLQINKVYPIERGQLKFYVDINTVELLLKC